MTFSPPEYCRLFAQKKAYQGGGGSRAPQDPPSYAPAFMVAYNCHGKTKNLTAKPNASQQKQIALV